MFDLDMCTYSHLNAYDREAVWSVIRLSRGICYEAVLWHRPGDEQLLMALVGEDDVRTFTARRSLAQQWRREQGVLSPTPEQQAARIRRAESLQLAIAAHALLTAQPASVSAALLGVTESRLLRLADRGERWFARELERRQDAVLRQPVPLAG